MPGLLTDIIKNMAAGYREEFGLPLEEVTAKGTVRGSGSAKSIRNTALMKRIRREGMREALRWGDAGIFFLAPGIMSWIVPVTEGGELVGGILGGEVLPEGIELDRNAVVYSLSRSRSTAAAIDRYIASLPSFPQERIRQAGEFIRDALAEAHGASYRRLNRSREDTLQQREIGQLIQQKKKTARSSNYSLDQERILLSLIRVGDKNAARGVLNDMLASSFLYSPKLALVKARMIETMGHLVRSAIDDSPILERLLDRQQKWINAIMETEDFEALCKVIRKSLDDFIDQIFLQGYNRTNPHVSRALEYISAHFKEKISLEDVADELGLSKFRISHLVKEVTGQTIGQHIKRMRVEKAQHMLANTSKSYVNITYDLGFTDQSAFIKQFRDLTRTTPAKYRRKHRQASKVEA